MFLYNYLQVDKVWMFDKVAQLRSEKFDTLQSKFIYRKNARLTIVDDSPVN